MSTPLPLRIAQLVAMSRFQFVVTDADHVRIEFAWFSADVWELPDGRYRSRICGPDYVIHDRILSAHETIGLVESLVTKVTP